MVRLMLKIKAELENVTDLQPATEDFDYFFQVPTLPATPSFIELTSRASPGQVYTVQ